MSDKALFDQVTFQTSRLTTRAYSTSFSLGIRCLDEEFRDPIYSIYGFVRFADEIVDSFEGYNKEELLKRFREDTQLALANRISLNPILNSFQHAVHNYSIDRNVIDQFLASMEMDLERKSYDNKGFDEYIHGSAEVVGLMCLSVFCKGNKTEFERLKPDAMKLGSAFQKVNFLRDLHADYSTLGRTYFPGMKVNAFDDQTKQKLEADIATDFHQGYRGIKKLPRGARLGVYLAYLYYLTLFRKIRRLPSSQVLTRRVRVRDRHKLAILGYSFVKHQLNLI